jgi:ribulose-5-phosphate 4-epimerase/fuculose-1-phosphate aldolase
VSCRTPRGDSFLLLPLRPPLDQGLPEDDVLEFDMDGKLISGRRDPPEEIFFYTCMYKTKKDAGAVIHCHPPVAVSLVATGKKIVPIHQTRSSSAKEFRRVHGCTALGKKMAKSPPK